MINKLRKKIIAINVVSVCIVFFVAIVLIFGAGYSRINEERLNRIDGLVGREDWSIDMPAYDGVMLVQYDNAAQRIVWQRCYSCKIQDDAETLVAKVISKTDVKGWASVRVLYAKKVVGNTTRIVLYDRYSNTRVLRLYVGLSLGALVIGALCYLAISMILARIALKPVEESWNKQKQFVADASHELKTPLSVIMANTEIMASHPDETVASQGKWIENTRSETQRMAELVNDLLFLAKNDDGLKVQMACVNLSDCVETTVLSYEAIFYENGKSFCYDIAPELYVQGNEGQLKQLTTILLDNANKYSSDDGNIKLSVTAAGKHIQLAIVNDCEPITDEQMSHLFDRFYTIDPSRNKNTAGNGLGLSIAQIICRTHGGNITAEYADGRITFTATLPVLKQNKNNNE